MGAALDQLRICVGVRAMGTAYGLVGDLAGGEPGEFVRERRPRLRGVRGPELLRRVPGGDGDSATVAGAGAGAVAPALDESPPADVCTASSLSAAGSTAGTEGTLTSRAAPAAAASVPSLPWAIAASPTARSGRAPSPSFMARNTRGKVCAVPRAFQP